MLQTDTLHTKFLELVKSAEAQNGATLLESRQAAFKRFSNNGFPTIRSEQWKYSNITGLLNDALQVPVEPLAVKETQDAGAALLVKLHAPAEWLTILTINGKLHTIQRPTGSKEDNLQISDVQDFLLSTEDDGDNDTVVQQAINKPFSLLNRALFLHGLQLEVKANSQVNIPVHIIHYYTGIENTFLQTRLQLKANKNAHLTVVESFIADSSCKNVVVNHAAETLLAAEATLDHFLVQQLNEQTNLILSEVVRQEQQSDYKNHVISLPFARFIRNNLDIALKGTYSHTDMHGLYMVSPQQVIDNSTGINHLRPNCTSNQLYKGIVADKGTGTFNGRIYVHLDAQKTNAFQKNANLPLGEHAVINSKPQLEIYADDVRCTHGSALGQMNNQQLFYLLARGIKQEIAVKLLSQAFVNEVTETIEQESIRSYVADLVEKALDQM
ncbi:Fe-S cluster assembly protein SufD [Deminuibacter soli]|uniref:Fe-S cluster assembly protein SufD n=1 Tax=Deminuibacter soli TaxID=2291815 RepID=A0A3E1NI71_9BACT|nr:Fe-S cluster assembly protein SufD [Deminuibacter soli]RFM27612.1 Fe-S cluster assembly protein SufD [Deminuibacter soli]